MRFRQVLFIARVWATLCAMALASWPAAAHASDVENVKTIASRILAAMESPERGQLAMVAISIDDSPAIYPRKATNGIVISPAFIDFMEKMAQALAQEKASPGYLKQAAPIFATNSGHQPFGPFPEGSKSKSSDLGWQNTVDTYFNHLVGNTLSIEFAHLYLNQYSSHQKQLAAATNDLALNAVLSEGEWQKALKAGITVSSRAGYGVDGLADFYEFIDACSPRPAWSVPYFPPKASVKKLRKQLDTLHEKALE